VGDGWRSVLGVLAGGVRAGAGAGVGVRAGAGVFRALCGLLLWRCVGFFSGVVRASCVLAGGRRAKCGRHHGGKVRASSRRKSAGVIWLLSLRFKLASGLRFKTWLIWC